MIFVIMNSVNSCFQETIELSIINHFLACSNGWDFEKYVKKKQIIRYFRIIKSYLLFILILINIL